ncbi:MAG: ATPase V [Spirochaetaceae bacterium]|nr:ATPase V [Spirochaetaceae bacterium]
MDYFFIGEAELLSSFRLVGVQGEAVQNAEEAREAFLKVIQEGEATGCRVLILTEEASDWLGDELVQWQLTGKYPLVVEIPGIMGRQPGRKTLVDSIREAIGIHV